MDLNGLLAWAGGFTAVSAAFGVVWRGLRGVRRLCCSLEEFLDDWRGTPSRDGVPGHPGVMARLACIEKELRPNGGESLRDAVNRIERTITR